MISQTAEYALRAVVYLATGEVGSAPRAQTTQQIAAGTSVPASYLSKVLQSLARAGLITSQRGLGGGFSLAKSATELTIYEVVMAVDTIPRIRSCPLGLEAHDKLCPLHQRLDEAAALIEAQFRATTIAELLQESDAEKDSAGEAVCEFPVTAQ